MRHLLRAQPLEDLDEAEVVEVEEARSNLIHPDLSQRVVDAAWKLTLRDGGLVYLLVECQSTPDRSMPFRIPNAVSALYLHLSRNPPGDGRYGAKRVPCVKHLKVYSGRDKWCSETSCCSSGWKSRRRNSQFAAVVISGRRAG